MKKQTLLIFSLILLIAVSGSSQSHNNKVTIKGHATFTAVYKGGARPTPEVLEACCSKRPMANATLYLKKNYYSRLQCTITTDNNGGFQKRLRPGKYNVFLKNERDDKKANDLANVLGYKLASKTEIDYAVSKGLILPNKLNRDGQLFYFMKQNN